MGAGNATLCRNNEFQGPGPDPTDGNDETESAPADAACSASHGLHVLCKTQVMHRSNSSTLLTSDKLILCQSACCQISVRDGSAPASQCINTHSMALLQGYGEPMLLA